MLSSVFVMMHDAAPYMIRGLMQILMFLHQPPGSGGIRPVSESCRRKFHVVYGPQPALAAASISYRSDQKLSVL